jgi:hypothetical protein
MQEKQIKIFFTPSVVSPSLKLYFYHNLALLIYTSVIFSKVFMQVQKMPFSFRPYINSSDLWSSKI